MSVKAIREYDAKKMLQLNWDNSKSDELGIKGLMVPPEVLDDTTGVTCLVERFDIESDSDFSAKWSNFIGLVLFCIDAKFCKEVFVGKLLTRSTRCTSTCFCTAQTSIFQKMFVKPFRIFQENFKFCKIRFLNSFHWFLLRCWWNSVGISPIL